MKNQRSTWSYAVTVLVFCLAGLGVILSMAVIDLRSIFAQDRDKASRNNMLSKVENPNVSQLRSLLSSNGLRVDEEHLLPALIQDSKIFRIRLKSKDDLTGKNDLSDRSSDDISMQLVESHANKGALARKRSLDLSPDQILFVAVDQDKHALWWDLQADPRVFHAETADDLGKLSGETIYRTSSEMLVACPADKAIKELYFYHPQWNGRSYQLQLIGSLSLN